MALPVYEDLVTEFENAYPHIQVRLQTIPNDIWSQGKSSEEIDYEILSSADVSEWSFSLDTIQSGKVLDLTPFIAEDVTFESQDFYPNMLESFQRDGSTWGVPVGGALTVLYYDRDAFDVAGLPYPEPGWTLEEFQIAAQQLTHHEGDQAIRYGFEDKNGISTIVWQASTVWSPGDPTSLFGEKMRAFVEWYADLHFKHGIMPVPQNLSLDPQPMDDRFLGVRSAMWTDFGLNFDAYQQPDTPSYVPKLGVVPLPEGWPAVWQVASPLSISAGTPHPRESWLWLNFVSHRRILISKREPFPLEIPARRSVAASMHFWESMDIAAQAAEEQAQPALEMRARTFRYAVERQSPVVGNLAGIVELLDAVKAVFSGEPVDQALAQAQPVALQQYLEQEQERARATPAPIAVVAPDEKDHRTTITFSPDNPVDLAAYRELARTFERAYPDIAVEIQSPTNDNQHKDCFAGSLS